MRHFMLAALLLSTPCLAGTSLPDGPHVVTSGDGKVTVAPDMATITLTAKYRNADASAAKRQVDQGVNALLKLAPDFGIGPKDVTAADLSLHESFTEDGDRRTPNGFVASREVTVDLRTLGKLSAFLDAAVAAGVALRLRAPLRRLRRGRARDRHRRRRRHQRSTLRRRPLGCR